METKCDNWVGQLRDDGMNSQSNQCRVQIYLSWRKKVKKRTEESIMYIEQAMVGKRKIVKYNEKQNTKYKMNGSQANGNTWHIYGLIEQRERQIKIQVMDLNKENKLQEWCKNQMKMGEISWKPSKKQEQAVIKGAPELMKLELGRSEWENRAMEKLKFS